MVDFVVRYETLEEDLAEVSARIGLEHNLYEDMKDIRAKGDFRPERSPRRRDRRRTAEAPDLAALREGDRGLRLRFRRGAEPASSAAV